MNVTLDRVEVNSNQEDDSLLRNFWELQEIGIKEEDETNEIDKDILNDFNNSILFNPLTPSGPQNLTTFVYGGFVDIWIREMDSSAFSLFLLTVGGRKRTGA
ncbi:hypothetical protein AVEN_105456-1 [Araneus ventricosus]|uniref:Uncharacterized protein n=1 Tax=Araneus ventricosus TaxID=182803 RepID=A0A4Y2Q522_ARAVE|nr:hypothetical protein AVEN_105456-1 [Araneus ventricosus]